MPPTDKSPRNPASITDPELIQAVTHLHRHQGVKGVKRVGAEFHGVNSKRQLVITAAETARKHAAYLDSLPDDHPDLDPLPAGPAPEPGEAPPA